jgi:hypothetical protein
MALWRQDGLVTYRFSYLASPHEEITMEPMAAKFIVSPAKLHIQVAVSHTSSYYLPVKFSNIVAAKFIVSPAKLHIQVAVAVLTHLATTFHLNF